MSWVWIVRGYGGSGDEEDLCKNDTKVAEWRTKGMACASVSRHFEATRNWTQLAKKSCYWWWVHGSSSTIHSPNGKALNGRVHCYQDPKKRGCSSPKPRWCWLLFLMSMTLSTQNSCHKTKLLISTSTNTSCDVWCAQWGRKEENCRKWGHGCFIMTMLQLIMPWEFGSFLPKITLLYSSIWSNHPSLQIWPLVTSFCFPNSRKSSKKLVFNIQKPLRQLWREIFKRLRRNPSKSAWKHVRRRLEKCIWAQEDFFEGDML